MRRSLKIALATFMVAGASACCPCRRVAVRAEAPLTGAAWQLVQMDGRAFGAAGDAFTLTFGDDGRVTGKGSCNSITAAYTNDSSRGTISFSGFTSTRMICPDQQSENRFLLLLDATDAYTIDGKLLLLFTAGERTMILEKK